MRPVLSDGQTNSNLLESFSDRLCVGLAIKLNDLVGTLPLSAFSEGQWGAWKV